MTRNVSEVMRLGGNRDAMRLCIKEKRVLRKVSETLGL